RRHEQKNEPWRREVGGEEVEHGKTFRVVRDSLQKRHWLCPIGDDRTRMGELRPMAPRAGVSPSPLSQSICCTARCRVLAKPRFSRANASAGKPREKVPSIPRAYG